MNCDVLCSRFTRARFLGQLKVRANAAEQRCLRRQGVPSLASFLPRRGGVALRQDRTVCALGGGCLFTSDGASSSVHCFASRCPRGALARPLPFGNRYYPSLRSAVHYGRCPWHLCPVGNDAVTTAPRQWRAFAERFSRPVCRLSGAEGNCACVGNSACVRYFGKVLSLCTMQYCFAQAGLS